MKEQEVEPVSRDNRGVVVAQLGARRHYAVPAAFSGKGRLARFHTDIYLKSRAAVRVASSVPRLGSATVRRIAGRTACRVPPALVTAHTRFGLEYKWRGWRARTATERTAVWLWGGARFCELVSRDLPEGADVVYAYTSAARELFHHARRLGMRAVLDHATAPRVFETELVREESERFPGWAPPADIDALAEEYQQRQVDELALSDVVVCGSSFVRAAVAGLGVNPAKLRVVPLGLDCGALRAGDEHTHGEQRLRVLFAGGDGLRKGVGYLSAAVERLGAKRVEARVAGDLGISREGLAAIGRCLHLLGPVPRVEMDQLFSWADVLVLPSISDTFGLVILEAMAAGVPVITTPHTCGPDVVRDGIDGFIVPIRDAEAIADRLERLAGNRELLAEMSRQARERSEEFSLERYAERLVAAVGSTTGQ